MNDNPLIKKKLKIAIVASHLNNDYEMYRLVTSDFATQFFINPQKLYPANKTSAFAYTTRYSWRDAHSTQ